MKLEIVYKSVWELSAYTKNKWKYSCSRVVLFILI